MLNAVIVVDDEASIRTAVEQWLNLSGFEVQLFSRAEDCLAQLPRDFPGVILSDVRMPGLSGLELLAEVQRRDADLPVILLTGHGDVPMAVEAMRDGAYDFLEKPFSPDALLASLRRALDKRGLILENRRLHQQADHRAKLESSLLGVSRSLQTLRRQVLDLAALPVNVLIRGETGSGKELVARCLHDFSRRHAHQFVALNCGGLPENLFESEIFGHEANAFTGAGKRRIGKIEHAHEGTLFLDEVESMPMNLQIKLLRVLQERTLERLGSNQSVAVDCRVIAATKSDLDELSRANQFRSDLYYRLNVVTLELPPLRERREDILQLFEHFLQQSSLRFDRIAPELDNQTLSSLMSHDWPGNVRELRNVAERFALGLPAFKKSGNSPDNHGLAFTEAVEAFERNLLSDALQRSGGNLTQASLELGMAKTTLFDKVKKYGLNH